MVKLTIEAIEKIAKEELAKTAFRIQAAARSNVPVRTGRLRQSISVNINPDKTVATIGSNVEYASAVEFGARPHVIKPKTKKALFWKGAAHPVKSVNHPGMQGKFYLTRAFQDHKEDFIKGLKARLST